LEISVLLLAAAAVLLFAFFLPMIPRLRKIKAAGDKKIPVSDDARKNSGEVGLLVDIEAPEISSPTEGLRSIPLPDIEF
jgi:hypothetical protein